MKNESIHSYKDLMAWQKAIDLVMEIHKITNQFPKEELYGLSSQMKRCAISIPSNIAEERRRFSRKDYCRFLIISYSSGAELETQIIIAKKLSFSKNIHFSKADDLLDEIMKMLNTMINKMRTNQLIS